jgi:nucleoside-diphosphate-sugar epimerase
LPPLKDILITGGGGYVGAVLVPQLLNKGYNVRVIDLFLYGKDVLPSPDLNPSLTLIEGDIRDEELLSEARISNDPSFELNPDLGKSINFDAFEPLVKISRDAGVERFIYASSSSVYGVSDNPDVTEEHPLNPITDYSKFKALCEPILLKYQSPSFTTVIVRPATVCGYSPRQRLDLVVNILTTHAVNSGKIKVFGGAQMRPNLHVADIVDLYELLLEAPVETIAGEVYNVAEENLTVADIALLVKRVVQQILPDREVIEIETTPTDDDRSYHVTAEKVYRDLGFKPSRSVEDAVRELVLTFQDGRLTDPLNNPKYYNIKTMQEAELT